MLIDGRSIPAQSRLEADLCIIGAGAAGITLAREFIGRSTRVILLESGEAKFDARTQALAEGRNVGLPYFPLQTSRLRWVGGTTNHWGGHCRPMAPEDLETKSWVPHSGWPITRRDLDPYYERARVLCGVPTAEWEARAWLSKDRYRPLPLIGERFVTGLAQIVPKAARNFRLAYRADLEAAPNIELHTGANVSEIETNGNGSLVTRLHVATLAGNRYSVVARRVVLAAGGIENPRILLASNRQWPRGLGNGNDLVGRFFMEHPRFVSGILAPSDPRISVGFYQGHRVGETRLQGYLSLSHGVLAAERLTDVEVHPRPAYLGSFNRALESDDFDDLRKLVRVVKRRRDLDQFGQHLTSVLADLATWQSMAIPGAPLPVPFPEVVGELMRSTPVEAQALIPDLLGDVVAGGYAKTIGAPVEAVMLRTRLDPAPNPDSRVTLGDERDELGMPRVRLDWRLTALDRHSVRRTLEILGAEVGRAGLGRVRIMLGEDEQVWPEDLAGGYHHMGTTRMSDDPKQGVVDRNGRVHGMHNLFVAGSSVFPTAGSGTPTMTLVALALRMAEHLKRGLA